MRTDTETLAKAMHILARDIQSQDGVANACIAEAAERLRELQEDANRLDWAMHHVSGKAWREIGAVYSDGCTREAIDSARKAPKPKFTPIADWKENL